MKDTEKLRAWVFDFILITIISFLTYTTNQILNNSTAMYVVSLGSDTAYGGMLISIFTVAALIARVAVGHLIDQRGARIVSIAGAGILGLCCAFFVLLPDLRLLSLWRIGQGIGYAALGTASGAAVAKILPPKAISRGIFVFGLGQSLALCAGPFIALSLVNGADFSRVYLSAAGIIGITIPLSLLCKYPKGSPKGESAADAAAEKPPLSERLRTFAFDHFEVRAIRPVLIQIVTSMAVAFIVFYLSYYSADKGYADAKLFFLVASITMVALRLLLSPFFAKLTRVQVLVGGYSFGFLCLMIIALTRNPFVFVLGGVAYGIFHGTIPPVLQTLSVQSVGPDRRGAATGTYYFAVDIGMGVGSLLWGFLIDSIGFLPAILCAAFCLIVTSVLSIRFFSIVSSAEKTNL